MFIKSHSLHIHDFQAITVTECLVHIFRIQKIVGKLPGENFENTILIFLLCKKIFLQYL